MSLMCPKCGGAMRSYERSGVTIEQCGECRGIFLDRGELEHMIDAEARYSPAPVDARRDDYDYDERRYGTRQGGRRRGFLGDLLDFD